MSFFQARPQFEDRQIVQYSNQSITLSGTSIINSTVLDFTGTTTAETSVNIAGLQGYLNGTRLSGLKIKPPFLRMSASTGTTTVDVTGYVLKSITPDGSVEWSPISGVSWSVSACTSPLYVTNIVACPTSAGTITITAGELHVDGGIKITDGTEQSGYVLTTDSSGNATWQYNATGFSGNTSATCISDLWVTNVHGCSPITVHDSVQSLGSEATGTTSFAFGSSVKAHGNYSHAEGIGGLASGDYSHIQNAGALASGDFSHAEGFETEATAHAAHAEGSATQANGFASHAEGSSNAATGNTAHVEGTNNQAFGDYSHAEGRENKAYGDTSHVEGRLNLASGDYSHAGGAVNTASGNYSHVIGVGNITSGLVAYAEGRLNRATGDYSHAEGYGNTASGNYSHVSGGHNGIKFGGVSATTFSSRAYGYSTLASGILSYASGWQTIASGEVSFVHSSASTLSGNNSAILGGSGIVGSTSDTVYVPNLNVRNDYILHSDSVLEMSEISNISPAFKGSYTEFDWTGITTNIISNNNPGGSSGILIGEFSDYPTTKNHGFLTYYGSGYTRSGSPTTGTDFYRNKFVLKGSDSIDGMVINPINNNNSAKLWWEIDDNSVMMLMGDGATKGNLGIALNPNGDEEPTANFQIGGTGTTGDFKYIDGNQQSGYVLTSDADGLASWQPSSGGFSGNTSATCISDIYVTNVHSCSPLNINPLDEGNVYFGSTSGVTVDITNTRLGVGTNSPQNKLHIKGTGISSYPSIDSNSVAIFENNPETTITLLSDNARNSKIEFGDELSVKGRIIYDNLNNQMIFVTSGKTGDNAITISQDNDVSIGGSLITSGSIIRNTRDLSITIPTAFLLTSSDDIIFLTTSSGGDIVLPEAGSLNNGRVIEIIRVSGTNAIRVGDNTANVNGTASPGISLSSTLYSKNTFTCDGSNWFYQTSSP